MYTYLNCNGQNWNQRQWKEYSLDMMKRDKEDGWIRLKKNNQVKYQYKKGVESEGKANQEQNE